jgi:uncharacterized membrane protein
MRVISLNGFLEKEFKFCYICGNKKYNEFYINGRLYRICDNCLKTNKNHIREFLNNELKKEFEKNK